MFTTNNMTTSSGVLDLQAELLGLISRSVENLKKVGNANITKERVQTRIASLKSNWEKFQNNHIKLVEYRSKVTAEVKTELDKLPYFADTHHSVTEELFIDAHEAMSSILESLQPVTGVDGTALANRSIATVDDTGSRSRRLPRIDLPKFGGNYCEWSTFSDLFTSLVGSSTELSCVEKLQYLKLSLTGTAAERIKNVAVTSENFQRAWDSLVAYYENKRVLVDTYLDALFAARRVSRESAEEIEQLLSTVTQAIGALQALNRPTKHWDDVIVHTTIRKLDPNSVKEWEREVGASTTPSTWTDLETFLVKRIRSLQAFERATGAPQATPQAAAKPKAKTDSSGARAHHAAVQSTDQCPCCSATHYVAFCPIYKGKTVEQRIEFITQKSLCYNCLSPH